MKNKVYFALKEEIINGVLTPGTLLVERELSKKYGISRTPIREILWQLEADGLVEQEPVRGYIVKRLTLEQIFEIFQAREATEGMAARLACQRADDKFLKTIREFREELKKIAINNNGEYGIKIGRKLHDLIIETADNSLLHEFYNKLKNLAALTTNITKKSPPIENKSKEFHLALIQAIEERDEDKTEQLMKEHLRLTCRQLIETFYPDMNKTK